MRFNPKYFQQSLDWDAVWKGLWEVGELAGIDEAQRRQQISEIMSHLEKSFDDRN